VRLRFTLRISSIRSDAAIRNIREIGTIPLVYPDKGTSVSENPAMKAGSVLRVVCFTFKFIYLQGTRHRKVRSFCRRLSGPHSLSGCGDTKKSSNVAAETKSFIYRSRRHNTL
jgi:hypothetical protein